MNVIDLLEKPEWNEDDMGGKRVSAFIKQEGFDVTDFSLVGNTAGCWEFVSNMDHKRGFILFFDPDVVTEPQAEYHVLAGNMAFAFPASCIAEAYVMHNRVVLTPDEYNMLNGVYAEIEHKRTSRMLRVSECCGEDVAADIYGITRRHLTELKEGYASSSWYNV